MHMCLQEEIDQKSVIRLTWRKLLELCERVTDMLHSVQGKYKKQLVKNVKVSASCETDLWARGMTLQGDACSQLSHQGQDMKWQSRLRDPRRI